MNALFVAWQDPSNRSWYPVGRLSKPDNFYQFVYTHGANRAKRDTSFDRLPGFNDLNQIYESHDLFPLFANRLPNESRPDYDELVDYLGLPKNQHDPISMLAVSGGRRVTDAIEMFPYPEPDSEGRYCIHFFVHGLRYFSNMATERVRILEPGEQLLLMADMQNPFDRHAITLRTADNDARRCMVGYMPRYLLLDAWQVFLEHPNSVEVKVVRVNLPPAPLQVRLLCSLTASWPPSFQPCADDVYKPIPIDADVFDGNS